MGEEVPDLKNEATKSTKKAEKSVRVSGHRRRSVWRARFALEGQALTDVQRVDDRWYYRRSVPLSNTFHTACVLCHANFTNEFFTRTNNPGQWVGALVLAVPIR